MQHNRFFMFFLSYSLVFPGFLNGVGNEGSEGRKSIDTVLENIKVINTIHELNKEQQQQKEQRESHVIDIKNNSITQNILKMKPDEFNQYCKNCTDALQQQVRSGSNPELMIQGAFEQVAKQLLDNLAAQREINGTVETIQNKQKSWWPLIQQAIGLALAVAFLLATQFGVKYIPNAGSGT